MGDTAQMSLSWDLAVTQGERGGRNNRGFWRDLGGIVWRYVRGGGGGETLAFKGYGRDR